jgi:hypothetical protein
MADCAHVAAFLQSVSARSVEAPLVDADLGELQQLGIIDALTPEQRTQLEAEVGQLEAAQRAIEQAEAQRQQDADRVSADTRRTHSILFHLSGVDKEEATVDRLNEEQAALQSIQGDLAKREAEFHQLLLKKAVLDQMSPYDGRFVAITTAGRVALRDLSVALYRVGDQPFGSYWTQAQAIDAELHALSTTAVGFHAKLGETLHNVDPAYLWAVAIGLAKQKGATDQQVLEFLEAYQLVGALSHNLENRLLAAEVIAGAGQPSPNTVPELTKLVGEVGAIGVPAESAAGVAAILYSGRRADGTYAVSALGQFLVATPSYESAALLAVVNRPIEQLTASFGAVKRLFASWGYSVSEDTELSAAYLSLSELPPETIGTKMAILVRGMSAYLQYPLVAAAVLASIPVLEANETLNLLEKAYEILGAQTGPLSQAELITLAVRLVHGVDVRSVGELDPTQAVPAAAHANYPSFRYGYGPGLWFPIVVVGGGYFGTYSAFGGYHPGHLHSVGAGGFGG